MSRFQTESGPPSAQYGYFPSSFHSMATGVRTAPPTPNCWLMRAASSFKKRFLERSFDFDQDTGLCGLFAQTSGHPACLSLISYIVASPDPDIDNTTAMALASEFTCRRNVLPPKGFSDPRQTQISLLLLFTSRRAWVSVWAASRYRLMYVFTSIFVQPNLKPAVAPPRQPSSLVSYACSLLLLVVQSSDRSNMTQFA